MKEYKFNNGTSVMVYCLTRQGRTRKLFAVHLGDELIAEEVTSWAEAKSIALSL